MKPRDLNEAVDQLVQRQRIRVPHDDGTWTWKTTPSLWELLTDSLAQTGGAGSGHSSAARLPISATVLDLTNEIRRTVKEGALIYDVWRGNTRDSIRSVAAHVTGMADNAGAVTVWIDYLTGWCHRIREALRLDPERPRWARGVACPACGSTHAEGTDGVETTRIPALGITWGGPSDDDRYHADHEWQVRAVSCHACQATWWRGDELEQLTLGILYANTRHETMTEGTMSA